MPPHTTVPPFLIARGATGTRAPIGARIIAASSGSGGILSTISAHNDASIGETVADALERAGGIASTSPPRMVV